MRTGSGERTRGDTVNHKADGLAQIRLATSRLFALSETQEAVKPQGLSS
jgi:hypothetical protein